MTVLSLALISAAAPADKPDPTKWVGPGLLGFLTIALIGVATFFLWRSMNKQLKKVDFEEKEPGGNSGSTGSTGKAQPNGA